MDSQLGTQILVLQMQIYCGFIKYQLIYTELVFPLKCFQVSYYFAPLYEV